MEQSLEDKIGEDWKDFIPWYGINNYQKRARKRANYRGALVDIRGSYPEKVCLIQVVSTVPIGLIAGYGFMRVSSSLINLFAK
jgi:hypothetical protein